jgi:uncharacterized membrane protein YfcA
MIFSNVELFLVSLIFMWAGFVRTGLGFGGAALGLPLMLLIGASPVYWLPVIGIHLLFFSSLTLYKSIKKVDWAYLKQSLIWIIPPTLVGVFGLIALPDKVMIIFVYSITIFYECKPQAANKLAMPLSTTSMAIPMLHHQIQAPYAQIPPT